MHGLFQPLDAVRVLALQLLHVGDQILLLQRLQGLKVGQQGDQLLWAVQNNLLKDCSPLFS